jgi:hypothetical protein
MQKPNISLILFCIISAVVALFRSKVFAEKKAANDSFEMFLTKPTQVYWRSFEVNIKSGYYHQVFQQVLEYHDARMKRDLPNSMALTGPAQDKFMKQHNKRIIFALNSIRSKESSDLWRLLGKLGSQNFDEDLVWTAFEIAARLSPPKFETIAKDVERLHPDQTWIIENIRERWFNLRTP